jgi:2OG-Fe(II) oxygenase superfamily
MLPTLQFDPGLASEFARSRTVIVEGALAETVVSRWREIAGKIVRDFGQNIERREADHQLSYRVVSGEIIREHASEMFAFYSAPATRDWVRRVTGEPSIVNSNHLRSAININCLQHAGQQYRWHFDAHPYTLLLYLTPGRADDGGALEVYPNLKQGRRDGDDWERQVTSEDHLRAVAHTKFSVSPGAGAVVLMDGTLCYHRVTPLLRSLIVPRLSIPMVFPTRQLSGRPDGLDDYLYRQA